MCLGSGLLALKKNKWLSFEPNRNISLPVSATFKSRFAKSYLAASQQVIGKSGIPVLWFNYWVTPSPGKHSSSYRHWLVPTHGCCMHTREHKSLLIRDTSIALLLRNVSVGPFHLQLFRDTNKTPSF